VRGQEPACTVRVVKREIRRAALQLLVNERLLRDRDLLNRFGESVTLYEHPDPPVRDLARTLQRIIDEIPEELRPHLVGVDSGDAVAVADDGTHLRVDARIDLGGETWVTVTVLHPATFDEDALDAEFEDVINELNIASPGCTWFEEDGMLVVCNGGEVELSRCNDRWFRLFAELYVSVEAAAHRAAGGGHASVTYEVAESLVADDAGRRFSFDDLCDGAAFYRAQLPAPLDRLVRFDTAGDSVRVAVPFPVSGQLGELAVHVQLLQPGEIDAPWAGGGIHLVATLPGLFDDIAARSWSHRLNGLADGGEQDGVAHHTSPWLFGNWRWTTGPGGQTNVVFHGFVPNRYRPVVAVGEVIDGAIRELWRSFDRYRLWAEFSDAVTGEGFDALAT
jgi:hypothetical protein